MENKFIKKCPQCGMIMQYSNKKTLKASIKNNTLCKTCAKENRLKNKTNFRLCPKCGKKITYKGYVSKEFVEQLTKEGKLCRSCISAEVMRGKTIYDAWFEKYGKEEADIRYNNWKLNCKMSEKHKGKNNPNYKGKYSKCENAIKWVRENQKGKNLEQVYGDDKAKEIKQKISKKISGKNNPMYGKPSPKRSGNGWSGYYKNHYFRSMLELHYLIYLVDNNINFESGEKKKYAIKYTMDNLERNYFPDYYLIDSDKFVEIKPCNLINSRQNKLKFEAAKHKLGNKYIILTENDIVKIELNNLYSKYINCDILFDTGYSEKFEKYCKERMVIVND